MSDYVIQDSFGVDPGNVIDPDTTQAPFADSGDPIHRLPSGTLVWATVGFLIVLFALLVLNWPTTGSATTVGRHLSRLATIDGEAPAATVSRIILNIGIYIIMLIIAGALIAGWVRGGRGAAQTLIIMAALGLMYMTGMALYFSAAISVCGFSLILASSLLAWSVTENMQKYKRKQKPVLNSTAVYVEPPIAPEATNETISPPADTAEQTSE